MQAIDLVKTGAMLLVPPVINDISRFALSKLPLPSYGKLYIRGVVITLCSILIIRYCQRGLLTFPYGLLGLYWQYRAFQGRKYNLNFEHKARILEGWLERLDFLDKHSKILSLSKFSNSSFGNKRKDIDQLLYDKIHNHERIVELISELYTKIIRVEFNTHATS